jgi:hypothetical protein
MCDNHSINEHHGHDHNEMSARERESDITNANNDDDNNNNNEDVMMVKSAVSTTTRSSPIAHNIITSA